MHSTDISSYLDKKGIFNYKTGKEIVSHCVFNDCDKDSRGKEAHLYIEESTGLYHCKKCDSRGNWLTFTNFFGDSINDFPMYGYEKYQKKVIEKPKPKKKLIQETDIQRYHKKIPENIREWLNKRGINDYIIQKKQLGYGSFYGGNSITIPIRDNLGKPLFFKLRRDPLGPEGNKYMFFPSGSESVLYGSENLTNERTTIFICEGEFDQMILERDGIKAITSTAGAGTFKDEWTEELKNLEKIYICFDNDETGEKCAMKRIEDIAIRFPEKQIYKVNLPPEMGKDVSDFIGNGGTVEEIINLHSELTHGVNLSKFLPMTGNDIIEILDHTIKHDNLNKLLVFLAMLSAYTEESQINIIMNAPSSSGKSYIPLEIAKLFPEESIMSLLYASQNAFFHEEGEYDKESNEKRIHLDRKIIIFIDQPRTELLTKLRPMLSHDQKLLTSKITDKNQQGGNATKTVIIEGYPAVIFCTASTDLDEQESTRFILLSPETHQEKIRDSIHQKIQRESEGNMSVISAVDIEKIELLKERIDCVRKAKIKSIKITNTEAVESKFLIGRIILKPRNQRDIGRFISLIQVFALLNLPFRKRIGDTIYAEESDISEAWKIWEQISKGQEYGVAPYVMQIFKEVFLEVYKENNLNSKNPRGVTRKMVHKKYFAVYGKSLGEALWRQQIEPTLENAGLLIVEKESKIIFLSPSEEILSEILI